jgi:uncharacterized membrane protein
MIFRIIFVVVMLIIISLILRLIMGQKSQNRSAKGLIFYLILLCFILGIFIYIFLAEPNFDKYPFYSSYYFS